MTRFKKTKNKKQKLQKPQSTWFNQLNVSLFNSIIYGSFAEKAIRKKQQQPSIDFEAFQSLSCLAIGS